MKVSFTPQGFEDFLYWAERDRKTFRRLVKLIADVRRQPFEGIGKPEPLKGDLSGYWSRRISGADRLVYAVEDEAVTIVQCRGHY